MTLEKIKSKKHKNVCHKKKIKFEDYSNCQEATQLENKISYLEKNIQTALEKMIKSS